MPFVRKTDSQGSQPPTDTRKLFIGRTGELLFFVQNILKPEEPTHNIISISGHGGVGKSTLLARFIDEAHTTDFKDYCFTAVVDERQITPASIMGKIADQLQMTGSFEKALRQYKDTLRKLQTEQETMQDMVLRRAPDFTGAAFEGVPIVGPILREGVKVTTGHFLEKYHTNQVHRDKERLEDPIDDLTKAFVEELNRLTGTQITRSSLQAKRHRRVILFFDTFEQLAAVATPWLLDYFLQANISNNVVLVVAGRDPIERSTPEGPKRWLPYLDHDVIYFISLDSFTEEETRAYLAKRGITDSERITTIWKLSGGLPLYLGLLTSNPRGKVDPTKDVVVNFLRWIPEQEQVKRQTALDAALLSRPFNQDDLEAFSYLAEKERSVLYKWLIELPFVQTSPQDGRGQIYRLRNEYTQSIKDLNRAIEIEPNNAWSYFVRGYIHLWLKDVVQARADFIRSRELNPKNINAGWMIEWSGIGSEKTEARLIERLEAIAELDPEDCWALVCRGVTLWLNSDYEETLTLLDQAIALKSEASDPYFWKGMAYASLMQDEAAIAAVEQSLELELPPILLTPLRWFEHDRPDFYQKYVVPLMARYDLW